jgi:lipopolysaccharide/colanic/teichoic acid biosynthesis glycosyltransferase
VFRIYKFRSMVTDAERSTGAVWATSRDPRVTRLGQFLRRTHLDELPQFFNVLRGEMSVVGPRPERPEIVERLAPQIPGYADRVSVLPGITGLAQVAHCYDSSLQTAARKLQYDLYYIRYASLLLDLKIMAATMLVMVRAEDGEESVATTEAPLLNHQDTTHVGPGTHGMGAAARQESVTP